LERLIGKSKQILKTGFWEKERAAGEALLEAEKKWA